MPKISKVVDIDARNDAHLALLIKRMTTGVIRAGGHLGDTTISSDGRIYTIVIEHSLGGYAQTMGDIIHSSKFAMLISSRDIKGTFDWKSEIYCKDASEVVFKMS